MLRSASRSSLRQRRTSKRSVVSTESDSLPLRDKRTLEDDLVLLHASRVLEAGGKAQAFGTAVTGHERQLQRLGATFAPNVIEHQPQSGRADALSLVALVDHEPPDPDLGVCRRRG